MDNWPLYFKNELAVGNLNSSVGLCILWSKKDPFLTEIPTEKYAVMGNLFSNDGINYILRNILANPKIRYLVLCGPDKSKSGETLARLFEEGLDGDHKVSGTDFSLEPEIEVEAIAQVLENVKLFNLIGMNEADEIKKRIGELEELPPFAEPRVFPKTEPKTDFFPSENIGMVIRGKQVAEVWVKLLYHILNFGNITPTQYSVPQKEILNVISIITDEDPDNLYIPEWFPYDRAHFEEYVPHVLTAQSIPNVAYTYGQRMFDHHGIDQIENMIRILKESSESRRAAAVTWDPKEDGNNENPPCLVSVHALVREDRLKMTCTFRSHDIYRAYPENALALRKLQQKIANAVGVDRLGELNILSQSAHLYEDSWKEASNRVENHAGQWIATPHYDMDPRGSFAVSIEEGKIVVHHYSLEGQKLKRYEGTSATILRIQLSPFLSRMDHALYLGGELEKAHTALKLGIPYEQDKPLKFS